MFSCNKILTSGIELDCNDLNASIGVGKDLILINYRDFDKNSTLSDIELDDSNNNIGGISSIKIYEGGVPYTFEGTDYSVIPNISSQVKEDGEIWFDHSIQFTAYSKSSKARNTMIDLGKSRVIAIVVDRSTGLYELFGAEIGLIIDSTSRTYTGSQNSNFYSVNLKTPDYAVLKENNMGLLSKEIEYGFDDGSLEGSLEYEI